MSASFYRAFEDRYRGSRELIHERQQIYVPFLEPLKAQYAERKALDVGCGRGEWLEILQRNGFDPLGVDLDAGMLEACHALGLPVEQGDALAILKRLPDASLTVVSGFHLAEHIPFDVLNELITEALRVLKPAGLLILETPNPENLVVGTQTFYLDPSHERPIPHLLLSFLADYCGFHRSKLLRLQEPAGLAEGGPVNLMSVLHGVSPDYAIIAQKEAAAEQLQAFDAVFERTYGLSLESLANRYDSQATATRAQLNELERLTHELHHHHAQTNAQGHQLWQRAADTDVRLQQVQEQAASEIQLRHNEFERISGEFARVNGELAQTRAECDWMRGDLNQVNVEIEAIRAQNLAYQQQMLALLNSASWRVTHPLRVSKSLARWTLRQPKRTVRSVLFRSVRFVLNRPGLRERVSSTIRAYPALFLRVRQFAARHGLIHTHPDDLVPVTPATEASEDGFNTASPRVAHIYAELKQAFERKENR
ncbi:methyltransferase domain-containing protein [Pseudomonas syringae]|nr:methyltransferase domain-containing protein [Pseudomonas syringae]